MNLSEESHVFQNTFVDFKDSGLTVELIYSNGYLSFDHSQHCSHKNIYTKSEKENDRDEVTKAGLVLSEVCLSAGHSHSKKWWLYECQSGETEDKTHRGK